MNVGTTEHTFREGDHALLRFGATDVEVEVIEERGPIGVHGRRLVRVRMPVAESEPVEFEIAEAELRPATHAA
jgi:hypothetical protein